MDGDWGQISSLSQTALIYDPETVFSIILVSAKLLEVLVPLQRTSILKNKSLLNG